MTLGFVGCGKMAEAMIARIVANRLLPAGRIWAGDVLPERRTAVRRRYGVRTTASNLEVARHADTLVLAVKPQQMEAVLAELAPQVGRRHLVISIAAGKRLRDLRSRWPRARWIRVMPNMPCLVGEAMSAFAAAPGASAGDRRTARRLLTCFGQAIELPEKQLDAVTALSGSGPAFFAYVLNAMVEAAGKEGLRRADALLLAEQTMRGTARLLQEKKLDPEDLVRSVASARGTTAAGLEVMERARLADVLRRTIRAAARRSRQLSG